MSREKEVTCIEIDCSRSMSWTLSVLPSPRRWFRSYPFYLRQIKMELDGTRGELLFVFETKYYRWTCSNEVARSIEPLVQDLMEDGLFTYVSSWGYASNVTFSFNAVNGEKFTETAMKRMVLLVKTLFGRDAVNHISPPRIFRVTRRWVNGSWMDYGDVVWYKMRKVFPSETF